MTDYKYEVGEIVNTGYGSGAWEIVERERGWKTGASCNFYQLLRTEDSPTWPGDLGRTQRVTESFIAGLGRGIDPNIRPLGEN